MHRCSHRFIRNLLGRSSGSARRSIRRAVCAVLVAVAVGWLAGPATAEMIVHVGDASVVEGASGFFDVFVEVTPPQPKLAFYMVELKLSDPTADVRFIGFAEANNAIFPGQIPTQTAARPGLPGRTAAANDFLLAGENPTEDGKGLFRVLFETDPGSLGVYDVTLEADLLRTNFSDGMGAVVPINRFMGGTITVVPEPSSLLLLASVGLMAVFAMARYRYCLRWSIEFRFLSRWP